MKCGDLREEPSTEFGWWLWNNMEAQHLGVRDVARLLRVTPATITNHIHGKRRVSPEMRDAYCGLFGDTDIPDTERRQPGRAPIRSTTPFGEWLKEHICSHGLTIVQLAILLDVSSTTISNHI